MSRLVDRVLIYAGFPKTASRWLMSAVWTHPDSGFVSLANNASIANDFIWSNPFDFDPLESRRHYESRYVAANQQHATPVIHHEGLSAQLFSAAAPAITPFEQLHSTFPGSRVILVVREQGRMLAAWYRHNVRYGLGVSIREYLREARPGESAFVRYDTFMYDKIVRYLYCRFGRDNVLVLPHELLRADWNDYLDRIYAFASRSRNDFQPALENVNVGITVAEATCLRWLNRLRVTDHPRPRSVGRLGYQMQKAVHVFGRMLPGSVTAGFEGALLQAVAECVANRFKASNQTLEKLTGLDLRRFGYDL